jgi:hypothetical protein
MKCSSLGCQLNTNLVDSPHACEDPKDFIALFSLCALDLRQELVDTCYLIISRFTNF